MNVFWLAILWLIAAVVALVVSVVAIAETHDTPGPIDYLRAILIGSAINYAAAAVIVFLALPSVMTREQRITPAGVILTIGLFAQLIPTVVFELYLLDKTNWLRRHIMAIVENGSPQPVRVTSGGPVPLQSGTPVVVKVKRLTSSKTFWIGLITVVIAASQILGELPSLAPYRDEMLAVAGILMIVMRVITNQPVNLR